MQWADRIGTRIKLRDLHVLIAVVQSGSMTKAAKQLAVSVPVVSKAISDLEHTLRVRILDRNAHGVELTPYGRALLDSGVAAFEELRQGVKNIAFLADPRAGEVRIGCTVSMATGFVSVAIERLSRKYPDIVVHLLTAESAATYRALEERKVDLAIVGVYTPRRGTLRQQGDEGEFCGSGQWTHSHCVPPWGLVVQKAVRGRTPPLQSTVMPLALIGTVHFAMSSLTKRAR
jgi:DNA-binding transcriptional LysR family regulator